jgi:uncharacterized protein
MTVLPIVDADGHLDEDPEEITALLEPPLNSPILGRTHGLFPKTISFENRAAALLRGEPVSPYRSEPSADKWLAFADYAGVEQAVIYPTAGLGIGSMMDPEVAGIMARGYNNWAFQRYTAFNPRLKCAALLPMQNPTAAAAEVKRVKDMGMPGACLPALQFSKPLGAREYWPVYEEAEKQDFFLGVHGTGLVRGAELLAAFKGKGVLNHPFCQMAEFTSLMLEGVFQQFPRLKVGFLEAGVGWMLYMLDRLDDRADRSPSLRKLPSQLIHESSIFVSAEPYEATLPLALERIGSDHIFCATDFPHERDEAGTLEYVNQWRTMDGLDDTDRRNILSDTARRAYSLPVLAAAKAAA